ncbi:helix-turn-helix domain-containing protein [Peptostreptococcus russellii]|uniref:helix-turn-helix domain-containing protein n=1 Tax=Peptostreptococcus russellii TaxID=215200 RepID=UPI003F587EF6
MNFGNQIKEIRLSNNLTQEQMAKKLNVSRQAVSNWENNKNLPDLEMIITISNIFSLSLDNLILGGSEDMNNMTEKLIKDGSELRKIKLNLIMISIATGLLIVGILLIALKGMTVEYIDAQGILHENFFLLPIGFLAIISSMITFFVVGVKNLLAKREK